LVELRRHYHPSAMKFANLLMNGQSIIYAGDPLQDFSQTAFLERFVYKNPKKSSKRGNDSIMQSKYVRKSLTEQPVNSLNFLSRKEEDIPEEQQFFYQFFKQKEILHPKPKKKETRGEDDFENFADDKDEVGEYDYDDMDAGSDDEDQGIHEADLELLGGLDSDDSDINEELGEDEQAEEVIPANFASAEDFAHLFEPEYDPTANTKQILHEQGGYKKRKMSAPANRKSTKNQNTKRMKK